MKKFVTFGLMLLLALAPPLLADGAATFKAKCAMCHGPDGAGQTTMGKNLKVRDLGSSAVQEQTDAALSAIIANGKNQMPAYKGKLSDPEIQAVVAFVRTLKN